MSKTSAVLTFGGCCAAFYNVLTQKRLTRRTLFHSEFKYRGLTLLKRYIVLLSIFALTCAGIPAMAQDIGRVAPASLPLILPTQLPVSPEQMRDNNPWNLKLTGIWRFSLTHGHINADDQYVSEDPAIATFPITASSSESSNGPGNAFDGDATTRWCATDSSYPQSIAADLGQTRHVTGVGLSWEYGADQYLFRIEGSLDQKTWTVLADKTVTPGAGDGLVAVSPSDNRFIRIVVIGNNDGHWASLREVQIHYQDSSGQDVVWQSPKIAPPQPTEATLDAFASPSFDDQTWHDIPVPSNWEMLGYSLPTYNSVDNTVGQYRRFVFIPASWAGKNIYWRFDGALEGAEIFVNGKKAGYHESGYTSFDVDLTGLVVQGRPNLFAVRLSKSTPSDDAETGDFQCMGGIYRETSLIAVPPTHVSDITVRTPLSSNYRDATLHADVLVQATPGASVQLTGGLATARGIWTDVSLSGSGTAGDDGVAEITLRAPVQAPALWSAEKPNLYYLVLQLSQNGAKIERVEQRFGFKQIDIKNHVVLWNGVPIKCEGICRHDFWGDKGFALTDAQWNEDLTLMKAANINAIRTSHYNHAERFLELCEERGFYILDEVPFCWINEKINEPYFAPYLLQRAQETLARDKNKPCVLAWSIGNENGYGQNEQPIFDLVKSIDPTRPAFVSQQSPTLIHGELWQDKHYPGPAEIDGDVKTTNMTFNYSESPHMFWQKEAQDYDPGTSDLWSEALIDLWQKVWKAPNILGSFIWEWQGQGIADKNADRTTDFYYGLDHLRDENDKGIVDSFRNPKPEYWIVKQVYSPVIVGVRTIRPLNGKISVPIANHYSFTDLKEVTTWWTAYQGANVLLTGEVHIACPPLRSVLATFPAPQGTTRLRLEFDHPDGTSIVATNLSVVGTPDQQPPAALQNGTLLAVQDDSTTLAVANNLQSVVFDKKTGTIQSWEVKGRPILVGGPELNIGELRTGDARGVYESQQPPFAENPQVSATGPNMNGAVSIAVSSQLLSGPGGDALATYVVGYTIYPDAEIKVDWNVMWSAKDYRLWEEGLKFTVPVTSNQLTWLRDSYFTDYPTGHIGEPFGTASSTDLSFRASKRNLHWLALTDGANYGLALLAIPGAPLVGRADATPNGTTLFASSFVSGPQDLSSAWVADQEIRVGKNNPLGGTFILRAISP
jgi:beta-galactosidase